MLENFYFLRHLIQQNDSLALLALILCNTNMQSPTRGVTRQLSTLLTLRHTYTTYSRYKQYGVSINSQAFNFMCGDQFNRCVWGLNATFTNEENVTNTFAEVGTTQSRREATTGDYRKHPHTRRPVREPFFTSGYIHPLFSCHVLTIGQ